MASNVDNIINLKPVNTGYGKEVNLVPEPSV